MRRSKSRKRIKLRAPSTKGTLVHFPVSGLQCNIVVLFKISEKNPHVVEEYYNSIVFKAITLPSKYLSPFSPSQYPRLL